MTLDARIAVVTTRERISEEGSFGSKSEEVWKNKHFKECLSPKTSRIRGLRVLQIWRTLSLEVRKWLRIGKIAKFSLLKSFFPKLFPGQPLLFCQPWKTFSAVVPETSKFIQNSSRFKDFPSERLLCKCSSGHVKSSFDNIAKIFPAKKQVFLVKVRKKRKTICSKVSFLTFFLCSLRLLFQHTWLFFWLNQKKLTQSPKKDENSLNYFYNFFSKFCWGHVKGTFSKLPIFFWQKTFIFAQRPKTIKQLLFTLLSKKTLKRSAAPIGCSFEKFDKKIHTRSPIIALNDQKTWAEFLHSKETS